MVHVNHMGLKQYTIKRCVRQQSTRSAMILIILPGTKTFTVETGKDRFNRAQCTLESIFR